jgi:hypothetical protein
MSPYLLCRRPNFLRFRDWQNRQDVIETARCGFHRPHPVLLEAVDESISDSLVLKVKEADVSFEPSMSLDDRLVGLVDSVGALRVTRALHTACAASHLWRADLRSIGYHEENPNKAVHARRMNCRSRSV